MAEIGVLLKVLLLAQHDEDGKIGRQIGLEVEAPGIRLRPEVCRLRGACTALLEVERGLVDETRIGIGVGLLSRSCWPFHP